MGDFIKRLRASHFRLKAEHAVHIAYCGLVGIEGHGWYAMAGGVLAVLLIVNTVLGGDHA